MKKILLLAVVISAAFQSNATVHEVEVGGLFGSITPFYDPQFITINQGDTVRWTWTSGTHNVTSTSGPLPFSSGDISSPGEFEVEFTQVGFYTYECTLFNHSETQFGTIDVQSATSVEEANDIEIDIYPNPVSEILNFDSKSGQKITSVQVYDINGRLIEETVPVDNKLSVVDWSEGNYILMVNTESGVIRERISVRK